MEYHDQQRLPSLFYRFSPPAWLPVCACAPLPLPLALPMRVAAPRVALRKSMISDLSMSIRTQRSGRTSVVVEAAKKSVGDLKKAGKC